MDIILREMAMDGGLEYLSNQSIEDILSAFKDCRILKVRLNPGQKEMLQEIYDLTVVDRNRYCKKFDIVKVKERNDWIYRAKITTYSQ